MMLWPWSRFERDAAEIARNAIEIAGLNGEIKQLIRENDDLKVSSGSFSDTRPGARRRGL